MDGELVDAARRGVQADEQFHDSRRKTRHTALAKGPEKSEADFEIRDQAPSVTQTST